MFSPRRETVILVPRGNGKSTLLAAIGLWHLLSADRPQAVVGAASREQAGVLFDIVRDLAAQPAIGRRVEITRREIRTANGWLRVVASDGPKQHGLILSLAIVDELHAHRDGELYTALRTGMLKRDDARMVTISTAGSHADTPLGELRGRALKQPKVEQNGAVTRATGPNLALLEWSLPADGSIDDMDVVKEANPASFARPGLQALLLVRHTPHRGTRPTRGRGAPSTAGRSGVGGASRSLPTRAETDPGEATSLTGELLAGP